MPDPSLFLYPVAGRRQFARHEWAQKAAYLLGCSLEELSSAIFKHQHKGGTLQRSTSFRQGPEESSLGDGTGAQAPWQVDVVGGPQPGLTVVCSGQGRPLGRIDASFRGRGPAPGPYADLILGD